MSTPLIQPSMLRAVPAFGAAIMALLVIAIRMKAAKKPATFKKIIIPPIAMSTGFLMFLFPASHIPWSYAVISFLAGLVLSFPLIRTSNFQVIDGHIYLKRSKAFVFVLLGLLIVRLALHSYVEEYVTIMQTGAVFFLLAFGMIGLWRVAMVRRYREISRTISQR